MATNETTTAPKKTRKAQGPRQEKPVFALFGYTDESGNPVKLDASRLTAQFTKDPAQLAKWFTEGDAMNSCFKEVRIGNDARPSPAAAAE